MLAINEKFGLISTDKALDLIKQGKPKDAAIICNELLQKHSHDFTLWQILGVAHQMLGHYDEAEKCYKKVLQINSDIPETHFNLGHILCHNNRFEEAVKSYKRAHKLKPTTEICINIAFALHSLHKDLEALPWYKEASELSPDDEITKHNYGHFLWNTGDFSHKINAFDADDRFLLRTHTPIWNGEPLRNKHLLVWLNEGLGDTSQFLRFMKPIKELGAKTTVAGNVEVMRVAASCPGVDRAVHFYGNTKMDDNPPDYQISIMNIPCLLGITPDTIPNKVPYIKPDPSMTEFWRNKLDGDEFQIGIVWQGRADNPNHKNRRSFPLSMFEEISRLPGVHLFGLQKAAGREQLKDATFLVTDLGEDIHDLMDCATIMQNLDLIITPDTATAHLAGALGLPVWIILSYVTDWRWPVDRTDSPWYPTATVFRQYKRGDWKEIFKDVAENLKLFINYNTKNRL